MDGREDDDGTYAEYIGMSENPKKLAAFLN